MNEVAPLARTRTVRRRVPYDRRRPDWPGSPAAGARAAPSRTRRPGPGGRRRPGAVSEGADTAANHAPAGAVGTMQVCNWPTAPSGGTMCDDAARTLRELGQKANLDFTYLSKLENDAVDAPGFVVQHQLASSRPYAAQGDAGEAVISWESLGAGARRAASQDPSSIARLALSPGRPLDSGGICGRSTLSTSPRTSSTSDVLRRYFVLRPPRALPAALGRQRRMRHVPCARSPQMRLASWAALGCPRGQGFESPQLHRTRVFPCDSFCRVWHKIPQTT